MSPEAKIMGQAGRQARRLSAVVVVLGLTMTAVPVSAQQTPAAPHPAGSAAGQTRAGEPCSYRPIATDAAIAARAAYDIFCGKGLDPDKPVNLKKVTETR